MNEYGDKRGRDLGVLLLVSPIVNSLQCIRIVSYLCSATTKLAQWNSGSVTALPIDMVLRGRLINSIVCNNWQNSKEITEFVSKEDCFCNFPG